MRSNDNVKLTDIDKYEVGEYFVNTDVPLIGSDLYFRMTETPTKDSTRWLYPLLSGHMLMSHNLEDAIKEAHLHAWFEKGSWDVFEFDPYRILPDDIYCFWDFYPFCCRFFDKK